MEAIVTNYNREEELTKLINICNSNLKNSKLHMKYLSDRNISDKEIDKHRIGYFPQNVSVLKKYVSEKFLEDASIISYSGNSDFSDYYSLIIPIVNEYKESVAIIGRTLFDDEQRNTLGLSKYKNSSYKKSKTLYGLDFARSSILKHQNVYVVEGNFDVITMSSNKIKNVVGICGAAFSREHFLKLAKYTDMITIMLDGDDGGKKSMEQIYKKFANRGIKLHFCNLPSDVKDVDEYFNTGGTTESFYKDIKPFIPSW